MTMHSVKPAAGGRFIACYRGAEIGVAETAREAALICAADAIEGETDLAFDVVRDRGQIFGNVKHMRWVVEAIADEIPMEGRP